MKLDRATIQAALSDELGVAGVTGEICIFGGAAMVLAFDARESTRDVDAVFRPASTIRDAVTIVAEKLSLPATWLNDGVKGFVSGNQDYVADGMPADLPHIRVLRPSAAYLLAMKCMAARVEGFDTGGDKDDVVFLMRHLKLRTAEEVFEIVTQYYPIERITAKTRFFVEELASEMQP